MAAHKRLQRRVLFVATTHHHTWWFQLVQRPQQSNNSVVKREIQCLKYPNALILTLECYWHERSSHFKMNGRWRRRAETQKKWTGAVKRSREERKAIIQHFITLSQLLNDLVYFFLSFKVMIVEVAFQSGHVKWLKLKCARAFRPSVHCVVFSVCIVGESTRSGEWKVC